MSEDVLNDLHGVSITLYARGTANGGGMGIQLTLKTEYTQIDAHTARRIAAGLMRAAYRIETKGKGR